MPIDEVKPGMVGTGRTIFEGTEMKDFKVHILGVLKNVQAPQRNLILAQLEGGPLAETGVIAGMSGSPVYIDGRLVGAVSYSIGAFPKEPIAGITPIGEMIEATADTGARARASRAAGAHRAAGHARSASPRPSARPTRASRMFADRPADVQVVRAARRRPASQMGALLRPIATPLVMSGMDVGDRRSRRVDVPRRRASRRCSRAEPAATCRPSTGPLRPGDPIGVSLLGGDGEMGATGTVTHVDGNRVYAFGHPFFNFGPTAFPMTRAHVYASLPSLMSSFKIATMGEVVGTMQQDRATAIAGTLGKGPAVIPITITLDIGRARASAPSRYTAVNDQLFTPLLTYVALFNTLGNYERQFGDDHLHRQGQGDLRQARRPGLRGHLHRRQHRSPRPSAYVAGPITMLLGQRRRAGHAQGRRAVGHDLRGIARRDHRARVARRRAAARRPDGAAQGADPQLSRRREDLDDPDRDSGERLRPADRHGHRRPAAQPDRAARAAPQRAADRASAQMIKVLNETHRNNRVYVRLLTGTPGAVVNGEALTSLPPSVLVGARRRSQRRQLRAHPQRRARRMGARDGLGDQRHARADDRSRRPSW